MSLICYSVIKIKLSFNRQNLKGVTLEEIRGGGAMEINSFIEFSGQNGCLIPLEKNYGIRECKRRIENTRMDYREYKEGFGNTRRD